MGRPKKTKWKHERRKVSDLKPHPANTIYRAASDDNLEELADDMKKNGQEHPIDILPDGTILAGEQRWTAAKRNQWTHIRCRVRYDLADSGEDAAEEFLLRDNLLRRQLDPIEVARVYRRLKQLAQKNGSDYDGDLRDDLAKRFDKSGRTLDRWCRLLDTPVEVQDAVVKGQLSLVNAGKAADLREDIQKKIAAAIRDGQDPAKVVADYVGKHRPKSPNVGMHLQRLIRDLKTRIEAIDGRLEEINGACWTRDLPTLRSGQALIEKLIAHIERPEDDSEDEDELDDFWDEDGGDE